MSPNFFVEIEYLSALLEEATRLQIIKKRFSTEFGKQVAYAVSGKLMLAPEGGPEKAPINRGSKGKTRSKRDI